MSEQTIGRYEIIEKIGDGGMAAVFLAHDPILNRDVAVKVLPPSLLKEDDLIQRFQREAQTIANLEHRAIVPVHDHGKDEQGPYLVMRHMRGGSLYDKLQRGPLSIKEASDVLSRIADALDRAHKAGVIHRDLKPGNILFDDDGKAYLADFGIVKLANADVPITITATVIGTPAYMSPEQAKSEDLDGRSDIYALGVILYEMLVGQPPYHATTPLALAMKHVTEPVPRILNANPSLPPDCERIIQKAMAKERDDRYGTAQEMADDLSRVAAASKWPPPPPETVIPSDKVDPVEDKPVEGDAGEVGGADDNGGRKDLVIVLAAIVIIIGFSSAYAIFNRLQAASEPGVGMATAVSQPEQPATATNEPPPTITKPAPPSPFPAPTLTPTTAVVESPPPPTATALPSPTTETIPTPTNETFQMRTTTTNVKIYAGPSDANPALGLLDYDVIVEVIGKVRGSSWYQVKTDAGLTGWVEANVVEFVNGNDDNLAVSWPPTPQSVTIVATSPGPSTQCANEHIVFDPNGDVRILWNDYPDDTSYLRLTVSGAADGSPLIYPSNIDQNDPDWAENGYTIGSWLPEQRGFPDNTTYVYVLQALDAGGNEICAVDGNFTK